MAWPLTWVVIAGTLPGVFIGYYLRVLYLPNPKTFKLFVGCVLLYIGIRISKNCWVAVRRCRQEAKALEDKFKARAAHIKKNGVQKRASRYPC